ncbi:hypothetical protein ACQP2U_33635 [Nocardia sp. CA-084685]|uniref:hypothetical protein n=1 Tax=Nocardia sp. CA-084685 TaxID=3239970 RepID=UPI003D973E0D
MLRRQQMHQLDQNAYGYESEHLIISRWAARESQVDRLSAEFVDQGPAVRRDDRVCGGRDDNDHKIFDPQSKTLVADRHRAPTGDILACRGVDTSDWL